MTVIDVHTHMLNYDWLEQLRQHGAPRFEVRKSLDAPEGIFMDGAPFMTPMPGHFDYPERIRQMDAAGVDLAIVSLTCPNVFWGGAEVSLKTAQIVNDAQADAQGNYPDRIRWFANLPWEYPELAVAELERACGRGAVGVMVLANIAGRSLTEPAFAPIWQAIDAKRLPVLVHPTAPPGVGALGMTEFQLTASIGFTFDTSLAVSRMIFDGFFDRYPNLKIIASHGGGALPFLIGRLDQCFEHIPACRLKVSEKPSLAARRIWADSVVFTDDALAMAVRVFGSDRVLYGSDYPHTIGDPIGCLARVDRLPEGARNRVRGGNAEAIFEFR